MPVSLVSSTTVGAGGVSSVSFTNIPQTGKDLLIYINSRDSLGLVYSWLYAYPNENTSATFNYRTVRFFDNNSVQGTNDIPFYTVGANQDANKFGNVRIYLPDYTAATTKTMLVESTSSGQTAAIRLGFYGFSSSDANPTTSFRISGFSGLIQNSFISLYIVS